METTIMMLYFMFTRIWARLLSGLAHTSTEVWAYLRVEAHLHKSKLYHNTTLKDCKIILTQDLKSGIQVKAMPWLPVKVQ